MLKKKKSLRQFLNPPLATALATLLRGWYTSKLGKDHPPQTNGERRRERSCPHIYPDTPPQPPASQRSGCGSTFTVVVGFAEFYSSTKEAECCLVPWCLLGPHQEVVLMGATAAAAVVAASAAPVVAAGTAATAAAALLLPALLLEAPPVLLSSLTSICLEPSSVPFSSWMAAWASACVGHDFIVIFGGLKKKERREMRRGGKGHREGREQERQTQPETTNGEGGRNTQGQRIWRKRGGRGGSDGGACAGPDFHTGIRRLFIFYSSTAAAGQQSTNLLQLLHTLRRQTKPHPRTYRPYRTGEGI